MYRACPRCFADNAKMYREFEVCVPSAFFTRGLGEGEDASEGGEIISAAAARLAEGDAADASPVSGLNTVAIFRPGGRLYTLNDNKGRLFKGISVSDNQLRPNRPNDDPVDRWILDDRNGAEVALVAPKTTDSLIFRLEEICLGLESSPIRPVPLRPGQNDATKVRPGVNSALWSAAFLIRSVAADNHRLPIERKAEA